MAAKESELDALKGLVEHADVDKVALQREVDEQKAVIGDLLFRLEEEKINKDDLQVTTIVFTLKSICIPVQSSMVHWMHRPICCSDICEGNGKYKILVTCILCNPEFLY